MQASKISLRCAVVASIVLTSSAAMAATVSKNTGSLGAVANGSNATGVTTTAGAITGGTDSAVVYNNTDGINTTVPYLASLNSASASSPYTIEFWAKPTTSDDDDAVLSNRVSSGNRSGWAFFQRAAGTGWNFRSYNGAGSATFANITGGTSTLGQWSQVVAVYNGSQTSLFVNGVNVVGATAGTGTYSPNLNQPLTVGTLPDQSSAYNGAVDEVAYYSTALSASQIATHFNLATAGTPSAYYASVQADGALLQLSNVVPEPTSLSLIGVAGMMLRRRRQ